MKRRETEDFGPHQSLGSVRTRPLSEDDREHDGLCHGVSCLTNVSESTIASSPGASSSSTASMVEKDAHATAFSHSLETMFDDCDDATFAPATFLEP